MSKKPALLLALVLVAIAFATPTTALAQGPRDQLTYFTFSAPITLPGVSLPAGRYMFRLVDSPTNRHVVQVLSADGHQIYATLIGIPAHRLEPSADPEVRFMETAARVSPAITTWWFPGNTIGHEFIYPKDQARRLAELTHEPVLTTHVEAATAEQMKSAELARVTPAGEETPVVAEAAPEAVAPVGTPKAGEVVPPTIAIPAVPTEAVPPSEMPAEREMLPKTATVMPLVGLVGVLALVGALALGAPRRRRH